MKFCFACAHVEVDSKLCVVPRISCDNKSSEEV